MYFTGLPDSFFSGNLPSRYCHCHLINKAITAQGAWEMGPHCWWQSCSSCLGDVLLIDQCFSLFGLQVSLHS